MTTPSGVIVTGGTGGLGRAVVLRLLSLGARVAVPFREPGSWRALREAAAAGEALLGFEADLATADGAARFIEASVAALGSLQGAALLAGAWAGGKPFEQAPAEEWSRMMSQNLDTAAHVCRAALPHLHRSGGAIVAVGSLAAQTSGAEMAAYAVAKSALHALVRVLALENRDRGVRVNAVLPGTIDTEANRRAMPNADRSAWTSPEAISGAIVYLLSPDSAPITGALVPVDART